MIAGPSPDVDLTRVPNHRDQHAPFVLIHLPNADRHGAAPTRLVAKDAQAT